MSDSHSKLPASPRPRTDAVATSGTPVGERIAYLDGLRGIAILAVIGFHYFTCFQSIYPYGSVWSEFPLFRWGYYGVHLFFAISGFVIALTLERCGSFEEFVVRRFARLWPTMLLCSVLTYLVLTALPDLWPQTPANFLPSLTLIDGQIWGKLIPGLHAGWIDAAYWSLFVELRFYLLAALLWFALPRRFAATFFALSTVAVAAYGALLITGREHPAQLLQWVLFPKYLPWFALGIAARLAAQGRHAGAAAGVALAFAQTAMLAAAGDEQASLAAASIVAALVLGPLYSARAGRLLGARWLAIVGASSYSLYLLHQYAGLSLISAIAGATGLHGAATLALALIVGAAMIAAARLVYAKWECPLNAQVTSAWRRLRTGSAAPSAAVARAPTDRPRVLTMP